MDTPTGIDLIDHFAIGRGDEDFQKKKNRDSNLSIIKNKIISLFIIKFIANIAKKS